MALKLQWLLGKLMKIISKRWLIMIKRADLGLIRIFKKIKSTEIIKVFQDIKIFSKINK